MRAKRFSQEEIEQAVLDLFRHYPAGRLAPVFLIKSVAQSLTGQKCPRVAYQQVCDHISTASYLNRVAGPAGGIELKQFWRRYA